MVAERTRPDIVQNTHPLCECALDEGLDYAQALPKFIDEFQEDTRRTFSDLDINALSAVPLLTEETL